MLHRNAGPTLVTLLALTLGIGVNTAVFTAYKAMVIRPLDTRNSAEMVSIALQRESGATDFTFSYPDYEDYRDSLHSFSGLVAFRLQRMTLSNAGGITSRPRNAEFAIAYVVSENYFKVLGAGALHGRAFDSIGVPSLTATPPVLISENYWKRRFAGDPSILGKTIHLDGLAVNVIGIAPHDFAGTGMGAPAFWVPIGAEPAFHAEAQFLHNREDRRYRLFGRLAPGANIAQAQAEMSLVIDRLRALHDPHSEPAGAATAIVWPGSPFPLPLNRYRGLELVIVLIMTAAAMVLVVACANVASLQLARARSRESELRTRLSLGAGRPRIVRQLVTESALVGVLAGSLALPFTWAILKLLVIEITGLLPVELGALVFDVTPDLKIFSYVLAISLIAGVLSGLVPAIESSRSALYSAGRATTSTARSRRVQNIFVAAQVALSLVLMTAGSVFIRTSIRALNMPTGYETKHVIDVDFQLPEASGASGARAIAVAHEFQRRFLAIPGVVAVTIARPPAESRFRTGAVSVDKQTQQIVRYNYVQPNYFQTLGIPLVLGGTFRGQGSQAERAVIVSESAAEQLWPHQNPVGRSLRLGPTDERAHLQSELAATGLGYQVVGVARDKRGVEFDGSDSKEIYLPLSDAQLSARPILIRTQSDPVSVMREIDRVASAIDPARVITSATLDQMLRQSAPFVISGIAAVIACVVGLVGLLLAVMGIYGTVSYIVVLRTREVGIRMAIGAQKRNVLGLILRDIARPVLAGLLAGIVLALCALFLARGLLYGLDAVDGVSMAGVALLFLAIALFASYPPARRAMRVDPMVALRYE